MTIWQLLNVSAAAIGLVIIVVMASIPFLDERDRATPKRFAGRSRHVLGPPPHPPQGTA